MLRRITLCGLLGALMMLALAWLCAAFSLPGAIGAFAQKPVSQSRWEMKSTHTSFGHTRINRLVSGLHVDEESRAVIFSDDEPIIIGGGPQPPDLTVKGSPQVSSETRAGWPWRALKCQNTRSVFIQTPGMQALFTGDDGAAIESGIELPPIPNGGGGSGGGSTAWWRALPYQPLWWGLIGDVLIFALVFWLLLEGPTRLNRVWRRSRGLCARCGYDLRGRGDNATPICPECGAETPDSPSPGPVVR